MDEKGTTLLLGMIEKELKGLKLKVKGTLFGKIWNINGWKGAKTLKELLERNEMAARPKIKLISLLLVFVTFAK